MAQGAILAVLIEGVVQAKITNVQVNGESGAQEIRTILEGLVGFSKGTRMLELSGTWVILSTGAEFDVVTACATDTEYEVQIPYNGKSIVSKGQFTTFGLSQSTDNPSEQTATFRGPLNKPK